MTLGQWGLAIAAAMLLTSFAAQFYFTWRAVDAVVRRASKRKGGHL